MGTYTIVRSVLNLEGNLSITNYKCIYPLSQQYYFWEFIPQTHLYILEKCVYKMFIAVSFLTAKATTHISSNRDLAKNLQCNGYHIE